MDWVYSILGTFVLIYFIRKYLATPTVHNKEENRLGKNMNITPDKFDIDEEIKPPEED